jgi:hypothetical protein
MRQLTVTLYNLRLVWAERLSVPYTSVWKNLKGV